MRIRGNRSIREGMAERMGAKEKSLLCVKAARHRRAQDVVVLDLRNLVLFSDFFVICTGRSDRQVQAIAEHIQEELGHHRIRPRSVEGLSRGQWVLMDYDDMLVHIFQRATREFYDLEGLWADAPSITLSPDPEEKREDDDPGNID